MLVRKAEQNQEINRQKSQSAQIISNKEHNICLPLSQNLNRTQFGSDDNYCQAISPTQKLAIDQSTFFRQQKRICINCLDLQKLLIQTEQELKLQRKKSAKYSKIIYAKVDKQRQLQRAYCELAKEMKKKIGLVMNIQGSESISNILLRQNEQINEQLKKVQAELAEKTETLQILKDKISSECGSSPFLRIDNKRQANVLDPLVSNISISSKIKKWNLKILPLTISINQILRKGQYFEDIKQDQLLCEQQTSEQKFLHQQKYEKDSLIVQNYIFDKQQNSANQHKQIDKKPNQQSKKISDVQSQFITVNQIQCESYNSVHSTQKFINSLQVINHTIANGQQDKFIQKEQISQSFYSIPQSSFSFSNISGITVNMPALCLQNNRHSDKYLFDNFIKRESKFENLQNLLKNQQYQSNYIIQQKDETQNAKKLYFKDKYLQLCDNFQYFYRLLNEKLNFFGKKYKLQMNFPAFIKNNPIFHKQDDYCNQNPSIIIQISKTEEAINSISAHLQLILKNQKKQYEKMLNDRQLYIADLKSRLQQANRERQTIQKIVENYQFQRSVSDINLLQKQENQIFSCESGIKKTKKGSQLIQSAQRKINSIKLSKMNDKEIECQIITSDILYKYQYLEMRNFELLEAISSIPKFLNQFHAILQAKINYSINFQGNLKEQIENMLKSSLQYALNMKKMEDKSFSNKVRSSSICIPTSRIPTKSQTSLGWIPTQKQSQQFKETIKQKNDQIRKMSQKITLQNIEKVNSDKIIENLKIEIYSLNYQLTRMHCLERVQQFQNQLIVYPDPTPVKKMDSSGKFMEYEQKKQYNNLFSDKQSQLKDLRQKIAAYDIQLKKCRHDHKKKKKLIYINN